MRYQLAALVIVAGVSLFAQEPLPVVVVTRYPDTISAGYAAFIRKHGEGLIRPQVTGAPSCSELAAGRVVFIHDISWTRELSNCREAMGRHARRGGLLGAIVPAWVETNWSLTVTPSLEEAQRYLRFGGEENVAGFFASLYRAAGGRKKLEVPPPRPRAETGIHHPSAPESFLSLEDYLSWYRTTGLVKPGAPLVGIAFFQTNYVFQDIAHVDALIGALERRGLGVVAAYGWPLRKAEPFFTRNGQPVVDMLFCMNLISPSLDNGTFLNQYRLHAINLLTTTETYEQWRASSRGLPLARVALQAGTPERAGAAEPILIATTAKGRGSSSQLVPIAERIEHAAARAARWVALRRKPNSQKRVALLYFNNPPGKATLGASYLNLMPSLANIVAFLAREGYTVDGKVPPEAELKRMMLLSGRNAGAYAPGEVEALVREGHAERMSMSEYQKLYRDLPEAFRKSVEKAWGSPESSELMTVRDGQGTFFVIPGLRIGGLFLGPQPLRGSVETSAAQTHDKNAPPPHSYIACYLWYRHVLRADALIHLGRHGTLEWLPGKEIAQSAEDAGEVLVGDLPHGYFYVVDGGGEYLQAKRRSSAVMISHLTPLLANAGVPPEMNALKDAADNRQRVVDSNPALAGQYEREIAAEVRRLRLDRQLGWNLDSMTPEALDEAVEQFLHDLEAQPVPLGLHAIGTKPSARAIADALAQFLESGYPRAEAPAARPWFRPWAEALTSRSELPNAAMLPPKLLEEARLWLQNIEESPSQELRSLASLLSGLHLPAGVSGDPLRTPDALPTGRNLYDQDPRTFPTRSAWQVGKRMADALIEQQRRQLGRYPEKVALVLWYGESSRQQGISEAQAFHLLGVEPVWNGRGQVDDVKLVPAEQLGRPRVDVVLTVSGLYRDGMPEKMRLLDKAARLVAADAGDNSVKRNVEAVAKRLEADGLDAATARKAASARIFAPAPDSFSVGISGMLESSRDEGDSSKVADAYLSNMNYAYSEDLWGKPVRGNLRAQLSNNAAVVHSRSTNLYGVLDNDETYQFAGGLHAATTFASGKAPEYLVSNVRRPGQEKFEAMKSFLAREMNARVWNPKWISAMKESGYAGAQQISKEIENLYGFRATAPEQVDAGVWQQAFDTYVADKYGLGMGKFFNDENPHAQQMLAARLLEVDRQGVYRFTAGDRARLVKAYAESIARNGVSCYANACDNRKLMAYILREAGSAGLSAELMRAWRQNTRASLTPRASLQAVAPRPLPQTAPSRPLFDFVTNLTPQVILLRRAPSFWEAILWFSSLAAGAVFAMLRRLSPPHSLPSIRTAAGDR